MPAGWLVIYLSILFWTPFNFWLTYASVAYPRFTRNPFEHTFQDGTRLTLSRPVDYLFRVILALLPAYLLAVIITTTILLVAITFVIIFVTLVAGSLFGFDFSLGLLEHVAHSLANSPQSNSSAIEIPILLSKFNPSNIPCFRYRNRLRSGNRNLRSRSHPSIQAKRMGGTVCIGRVNISGNAGGHTFHG